MSCQSLYPCGRINRRGFITQAGGGFFGAALGAMWAQDGKLPQDARLQEALLGGRYQP